MSGKRLHAIKSRGTVGIFHVERYIVCRCGWQTERHYSAGVVAERFKAHQAERLQAGER